MSDKQTGGSAFPHVYHDELENVLLVTPGMTLRQYAAITLKVPDSGVDWLDEMIKQSLKNDFSAKVMQWVASDIQPNEDFHGRVAKHSYKIADAMLRAQEVK